jgi:hypothetical protein
MVGTPARLDWDYFNNMAYVRVTWLSHLTMKKAKDIEGFVLLMLHEIDMIQRARAEYETTETNNQ